MTWLIARFLNMPSPLLTHSHVPGAAPDVNHLQSRNPAWLWAPSLPTASRRISFLSGSTETTPGDAEPEMGAGIEVSG